MKLAIFPSTGLGDGIIQLVLAQNLNKIGLQIDYYHHYLADIGSFIKGVNVCRPSTEIFKDKIDSYDVVLLDKGSKLVDLSKYEAHIESKLALYTMAKKKSSWFNKTMNHLENSSFSAPTLIFAGKSIDFNVFNGQSLRADKRKGLSTAGSIVHFLKSNNIVESPDYELTLSLPGNWHRLKHHKRVSIHPTSASEQKNWLPGRFIGLARKLKNLGYEPVFTVSPSEREIWRNRINNEFELPLFESISDLAKYYYESGLFIGNDSGNGHLASALGLTTITIVNRYSNPFPWRPNWSRNIIVRPILSRNLVGNHYWKFTISDKLILESILKIQS